MRRMIIWVFALLLMAAAVSAAAEAVPADVEETERAEWTVMFYLCGSDLESKNGFASENLKEIYSVTYPDSLTFIYSPDPEEEMRKAKEATGPGKVNVLIETGGSKAWHMETDLERKEIFHFLEKWQHKMTGSRKTIHFTGAYYKSLFLTKQIIAHTDFCNKPVPIMEKAINVFRKFDKAIIDKTDQTTKKQQRM